jgi:hypothetical protein
MQNPGSNVCVPPAAMKPPAMEASISITALDFLYFALSCQSLRPGRRSKPWCKTDSSADSAETHEQPDPTTFAPAPTPAQGYARYPASTFRPSGCTQPPSRKIPASTFAVLQLRWSCPNGSITITRTGLSCRLSQPIFPRSAEQVFGARPTAVQTPVESQSPEFYHSAPVPEPPTVQDLTAMFVAPPAATERPGMSRHHHRPSFPRPGHCANRFAQIGRVSKSWWKTEPIADTDQNASARAYHSPHPPRWIGSL